KQFLDKVCRYLLPDGRVVIISYHSLEDRMVKEFMRSSEQRCTCDPGQPFCTCSKPVLLKRITRKAIKASESEIESNPRARSARLRAAQRTQEVLNEEEKSQ
ncbi:MAG: 16S rRNA (cytosine(1402)-N(4))-methyltransferase, partial [Fibrobacter sp.]|nr:16S rRNA (cytosine(1402)-N(4))-methyltransferase [Fibrobacter sp.]